MGYCSDDEMLRAYDEENWSVWSELSDALFDWTHIHNLYWGLGSAPRPSYVSEATWESLKKLESRLPDLYLLATVLEIRAIQRSGEPITLATEELKLVQAFFRSQSKWPPVSASIEIQTAKMVVRQASGAGDRARRLFGLVQVSLGSEQARRYIKRATTLYIAGYEPESVVMVRGALEAALFTRLEAQLDPEREPPSLEEMLRKAGEQRILEGFQEVPGSKRGWKARPGSLLAEADGIRRQGNHLVHSELEFRKNAEEPQDAFNAIRSLVRVVGALFPPTDA